MPNEKTRGMIWNLDWLLSHKIERKNKKKKEKKKKIEQHIFVGLFYSSLRLIASERI